jgi:pyrroloquinoline quinone biosynthesis protein E
VLPCHAAQTIPSLQFEQFGPRSLADIWIDSPAFNAFRGTDWMLEPCRGCERREIDWGGCRCQAMAIAGDAAATDPACIKSPLHALMTAVAKSGRPAGREAPGKEGFVYRRIGAVPQPASTVPLKPDPALIV